MSADTVTVSNYEQLSKNISNAQNDRTIIIAEDIPVGANQWFTVTKNITLTTTANADHRIYRTVAITSNQNGMFTIQNGGNLTIQGNNSKTLTLDGNQTEVSDNGQTLVWINSGGNFTLNSGGVLTNNNVTGQSTTSPGEKNSGAVYVFQGTFTMNGGEISNNTIGNSGGGVYVYKGIFTMDNGKISNNTAGTAKSDGGGYGGGSGGGVCIYTGTFTMKGGTITNNTAIWGNGGGVYLLSDSNQNTKSVFTMTGGEISNNTAGSGNGGGVDVRIYCVFTMFGGKITGNTAKGTGQGSNLGNGGGVGITSGTFTMSGGTITDNEADTNGTGVYVGGVFNIQKSGTVNGVYLPDGKNITVTGTLNDDTAVTGIIPETPEKDLLVVDLPSDSEDYLTKFTLDDSVENFALKYQQAGRVGLVLTPTTHTVTFEENGGTSVPDKTVNHGDTVDKPDDPTKDGHTFAGWHEDELFEKPWNFNTDTVTDDMTLYAKWTPNKPGPTPVPPSGGVSSDGNMDNAYRVLFNDGATTLYIVTDLSAGDKLTKPEDPVKDGYTFAGWHKDTACTQPWDFNDGITGDMTLYAKWTAQATATPTVTPTATATVTPTVTATATTTATPTGDASPAQTSQPDNNGNNGDTTATSGISLSYLIGGILILLLAILLLLILLLRHTVTFLIPTGGELEEYRIKVWHGRYINTEDLPDLIRTAAWYRDPARQERWDFDQDRVKKSIELYLG